MTGSIGNFLEKFHSNSASGEKKNFKPIVFIPSFILLAGTVIFSFIDYEGFTLLMTGTVNWIFTNFAWMFNLGCLLMVFVVLGVWASPLGKVKIGGANAVPILSPWKWWSVTLCTGIAIGILLWGTAEPMFHISSPPESLGIAPNSKESVIFAMSTLFLHWTFTPYAFYTVPAVMFAFAYYNMRKPYSIGSMVCPIFGEKSLGVVGQIIDTVCVFSLVCGVAASLGAGIMSVAGGLEHLFGITPNPIIWLLVDSFIVGTFIVSAITGITKGIKWLCDLNAKLFFGMVIFVVVFGPLAFNLNLGMEGLGNYFTHFFEKSLFTGAAAGDQWPMAWTVFYFALWIAWCPITAVFLAQISVGYTFRKMILVNFLTPAVFSVVWMIIFGGTAIHMEWVDKLGFASVVLEKGTEAAAYFFFSHLPMGWLTIPVFIFAMYLSFVTGADALVTAVGGLCSTGISPESPEPRPWLKIVWGIVLGAVAWVMIAFRGIDGVKMVGTIGGLPAMILMVLIMISLVVVASNPKKYDVHKDEYDKAGNYIGKMDDDLQNNTMDSTNLLEKEKVVSSV